MKVGPIVEVLSRTPGVDARLVHTGQHYDERMSRFFFEELGLPEPDLNLEVGSGSQAAQTAEIMKRFEPVCAEERPDWVIVVGDVNSTLAAALVAAKLGNKVAHVEAGLRSFDRTMPEEINRILTDTLSDLLFVTEPSGAENLRNEGIAERRIHLVGNVMVDSLLRHRERAERSTIVRDLGLNKGGYAVVTLHRPSNVDRSEVFQGMIRALGEISQEIPVVFPAHPRTAKIIRETGMVSRLDASSQLRLMEPLGYLDFMKVMADSAMVLTDSGGIQEETTMLGVTCLTLRENTERPITIAQGTNRLAGCSPDGILAAYREARSCGPRNVKIPVLWDGRAAERIVERLLAAS
jgi:UDP-N-acetylglucosamine 2-epimerase (non-hydrolysing)